jgi:hypothetical protein
MTRCLAAPIASFALATTAFAHTQNCNIITDPAQRLTRPDGTTCDPQGDGDAQARMRNIACGC